MQRALVDPAWRSQLLIGITDLNWLHQDEPLFSSTVDAIAEAGFNKFRVEKVGGGPVAETNQFVVSGKKWTGQVETPLDGEAPPTPQAGS